MALEAKNCVIILPPCRFLRCSVHTNKQTGCCRRRIKINFSLRAPCSSTSSLSPSPASFFSFHSSTFSSFIFTFTSSYTSSNCTHSFFPSLTHSHTLPLLHHSHPLLHQLTNSSHTDTESHSFPLLLTLLLTQTIQPQPLNDNGARLTPFVLPTRRYRSRPGIGQLPFLLYPGQKASLRAYH